MAKRTARFPDRKISETILDFARLIPQALPSEAPERRAREALTVACTVWNAVVFADVLPTWVNPVSISRPPSPTDKCLIFSFVHVYSESIRGLAAAPLPGRGQT